MHKKVFLILSLIVVLSVGMTACKPYEGPVAPEIGTADNPVIIAFAPSMTSEQITENGEPLAAKLSELTGYQIKTSIPTSYAALIEAMGSGNAHIALFPTFAYLIAKDKGYANVGLVAVRYGSDHYGAQFVAAKSSGFTSYFNMDTNENTADEVTALAQFAGKKPCWTDPLSVSGYIIPDGYLKKNGVETPAGAFVQGHPTVITALYVGGICDFGATFIDARTNPKLNEQYPDVQEKIDVIWRTDPVIPNDNISFSTKMSDEMIKKFQDTFLAMSQTDEGKALFKGVYEIESWNPADDTFYDEFRVYLQASGYDYTTAYK